MRRPLASSSMAGDGGAKRILDGEERHSEPLTNSTSHTTSLIPHGDSGTARDFMLLFSLFSMFSTIHVQLLTAKMMMIKKKKFVHPQTNFLHLACWQCTGLHWQCKKFKKNDRSPPPAGCAGHGVLPIVAIRAVYSSLYQRVYLVADCRSVCSVFSDLKRLDQLMRKSNGIFRKAA